MRVRNGYGLKFALFGTLSAEATLCGSQKLREEYGVKEADPPDAGSEEEWRIEAKLQASVPRPRDRMLVGPGDVP